MSTDIPQAVDETITVISEDVKVRMMSNRIPPKSFSYPQKDFFDKLAKNGMKKRSCKREWLTKNPLVSYFKTLDGLFGLCCIFFPTSAHQGQRAQNLTTFLCKNWQKALGNLDKHAPLPYHLTFMTRMQSFLQIIEIPSSRIDNKISFNEANMIKENCEYLYNGF